VLHVHNAEGLAVGMAASRLTGVPLVYHAHSRLAAELPHYAGGAVGRLAARLGGVAFDHLLPRSAKAVICFDHAQAERMRRAGVPAERLHVIAPGLAMDELDEAGRVPGFGRRAAVSRCDNRIVYAGNPDAYQNLDLLRAAFARVRSAVPRAALRLVSNHAIEAFGPLARDPGVEHRTFAGPAELGTLLRGAAVGVVTRTLDAGAPVKALTYLSAGLPVVACETGTAGLLRPYPGACRLTASTPEAVADALVSMLGRTRKAGIDEARRALDIRRQITAYDAVYELLTTR
jgi:glycosyltransferase involved in cell wall biosynthesis